MTGASTVAKTHSRPMNRKIAAMTLTWVATVYS
jgi:hypothetical protein